MHTSMACCLTAGLTWQIWQVSLHCCTCTTEYSEQQQDLALKSAASCVLNAVLQADVMEAVGE